MGLAKGLAPVPLKGMQGPLAITLTPVAIDSAERRSHLSNRAATQGRTSSDEQEKQPSRNEIAKKPSRSSDARRTPVENSVRQRGPHALRIQREKILIWQDFDGAHKSRCIRAYRKFAPIAYRIIPMLRGRARSSFTNRAAKRQCL